MDLSMKEGSEGEEGSMEGKSMGKGNGIAEQAVDSPGAPQKYITGN